MTIKILADLRGGAPASTGALNGIIVSGITR